MEDVVVSQLHRKRTETERVCVCVFGRVLYKCVVCVFNSRVCVAAVSLELGRQRALS